MRTALTVSWWLLRTLAQAVQLLLVALILTGRWAVPRGWRLAVRGSRGVYRWYASIVVPPAPPPAVAPPPVLTVTLADLRTKEPANS